MLTFLGILMVPHLSSEVGRLSKFCLERGATLEIVKSFQLDHSTIPRRIVSTTALFIKSLYVAHDD
jgi:hypothetical protein